jgi:hypothetical protein
VRKLNIQFVKKGSPMHDIFPLYLLVVIVACMMLSEPSEAADFNYSPFTHHLFSKGLNETNHIKTVHLNNGVILGQYHNSFNRNSVLVGWATRGNISIGVVGVTGYKKEDFNSKKQGDIHVLPMAVIQGKYMVTDQWGVSASAVGFGVLTAGIVLRIPEF